jgi:hypothetical protein
MSVGVLQRVALMADPFGFKDTLAVDTVILGDTPYALFIQDILRTLGETTCLIYTGEHGYKYLYSEEVQGPHLKLLYPLAGRGMLSPLEVSEYKTFFRKNLGGDYAFLYSLLDSAAISSDIPISISSVPVGAIEGTKRGFSGNPSVVAILNKFIELSGVVVHYSKLVVTESLRVFLGRIGEKIDLPSQNMGFVVEESVDLLPGEIRLGRLGASKEYPLCSISRGYLTYHYYAQSDKCNVKLIDYIRTPTSETYSLSSDLEQQDVHLVGPRAMWNSSLTLSSEFTRVRYLYS